jgi:phosphate starvation-inducible PhoH-like protein
MFPDAGGLAASRTNLSTYIPDGSAPARGPLVCAFILQSTRRSRTLGKNLNRKKRRHERQFGSAEIINFLDPKFEIERALPPIKALNPTQADYLDALRKAPQVIVLGPAGTGKTWIAASHAADLLRNRRIDKIILTRPNVPCGRSLGYFPGSLEDKFAPWAAPVAEAIKERIGKAAYAIALKNGGIELVPFEVMRGRSWKNAFVLLDEAQNATPAEIKTFLTRIGEDCTVVINGDVSQCDLDKDSGLRTVISMIDAQKLPVPVIEFTRADIVRSGICAMWVNAFEEAQAPNCSPAII